MKKFDKTKFIGRRFQCNTTKEIFTIPEDVRPKDFYTFGDGCFIDVGDGYYSRWGGDFAELKEITPEDKNQMNTNIRPIIIDLVNKLRYYPDNWEILNSNYYYRISGCGIVINNPHIGLLRVSSSTSPENHIELNSPEHELVYNAAIECYNYLRDKRDRENQHKETEFLETSLEELKSSREGL